MEDENLAFLQPRKLLFRAALPRVSAIRLCDGNEDIRMSHWV